MYTYDIRDRTLMNDIKYMVKNIQDMLNDYSHNDRFDQIKEVLIYHTMVYLN